MKELIWGIVIFIVTFIVNYLFIYKIRYYNSLKKKGTKRKKYKGLDKYVGFSYLIPKFNLDMNKINVEFLFVVNSIINAFIISVVIVIIFLIPWRMEFSLLLGFVLLFGLIYSLYELFGRILVRKGWQKE